MSSVGRRDPSTIAHKLSTLHLELSEDCPADVGLEDPDLLLLGHVRVVLLAVGAAEDVAVVVVLTDMSKQKQNEAKDR